MSGHKSNKFSPIFDPARVPAKGMFPSVHPTMLPPGHYQRLQNIRISDGLLGIRTGATRTTSAVPTGATSFRGAWSGTINGNYRKVRAYYDGSRVRVYDLTGTTWTELTESADATYGNTRFATDGPIYFAVARDRFYTGTVAGFDEECLVIQNGADTPRIWTGTVSAGAITVHGTLTAPSLGYALPTMYSWFNIKDGARTAYTGTVGGKALAPTTAAEFDIADDSGASSTANFTEITWQTGATVSAGETLGCVFSGSGMAQEFDGTATWSNATYLNLSNSRHLVMVCQPVVGDTDIASGKKYRDFSNIKLELYDAATTTWYTVWSPESTNTRMEIAQVDSYSLPSGQSPIYAASIELGTLAATLTQVTAYFITNLYDQSVGGTDYVLNLYTMCGDGKCESDANFEITHYDLNSHSESPPLVLENKLPAFLSAIGGPTTPSVAQLDNARLPLSPHINYVWALYAKYGDGGTDDNRILTYQKDRGEDRYYWVNATTITSGTGIFRGISARPSDKYFTRKGPDSFNIPVPKGSAIIATASRLYVGGALSSSSEDYMAYYWSELGLPFRFRRAIRGITATFNDPDSGGRQDIAGEPLKALAPISGGGLGTDSIILWTDTWVWRLDGSSADALATPARLAPHGCPWPFSVAVYGSTVYWVDQERQVRRYSPEGLSSLSRNIVDSILASATLTYASGAFWRDRYYLGIIASGRSLYDEILIFDERAQGWTIDRLADGDAKRILVSIASGTTQLDLLTEAGHEYKHETASTTQDNSVDIAIDIIGPEYHNGIWGGVGISKMGIATDIVSGNITFYRYARKSGVIQSNVVSLVEATNSICIRSDEDSVGGVQFEDTSIYPRWAGSGAFGGKKIFGLTAQFYTSGKPAHDVAD